MKVALISEWLDAWRGGAEASTRQFLYELLQLGVEVHVFTRSRPACIPGLTVRSVSGAAMSRTRRSMTFAHRVERMIRSESFDVVHAISPFLAADIYQPRGGTVAESIERNLALAQSPAMRAIKRQANRFNVKQRYMLAMERRMIGRPNGPIIVAISNYVVRQLKEHYSLPDSRWRMIYNAVEVDTTPDDVRKADRHSIRREFGIADDELLVLVVAHNFRLKGVHRWMEALSLLVSRGVNDVRALVVGKGESARWHKLASKLGISRQLIFTGPSDRVTEFRHAADVIVHPTYFDPCSRVVLEAMSSGLPCVATRWDGSAEMIDDGRNGFVIDDPADVAALADRVEQLRDPQLRKKIGSAAKEVADHVSMSRHASEMLKLYEDIVASRATARTNSDDRAQLVGSGRA